LGCHPVAVHIYTQTVHRTSQLTTKQYEQQTKQHNQQMWKSAGRAQSLRVISRQIFFFEKHSNTKFHAYPFHADVQAENMTKLTIGFPQSDRRFIFVGGYIADTRQRIMYLFKAEWLSHKYVPPSLTIVN
jgi:hypothetical protein